MKKQKLSKMIFGLSTILVLGTFFEVKTSDRSDKFDKLRGRRSSFVDNFITGNPRSNPRSDKRESRESSLSPEPRLPQPSSRKAIRESSLSPEARFSGLSLRSTHEFSDREANRPTSREPERGSLANDDFFTRRLTGYSQKFEPTAGNGRFDDAFGRQRLGTMSASPDAKIAQAGSIMDRWAREREERAATAAYARITTAPRVSSLRENKTAYQTLSLPEESEDDDDNFLRSRK